VLRSLALKGRRFEGWAEIENAIACATAYWNDHRHPFIWGRRPGLFSSMTLTDHN